MRRQIIILSVISLVVIITSCEKITEKNLLTELNELDNVSATEIAEPGNSYPRQFALGFTMPVDQNNPNGATYTHRGYLSHRDSTLYDFQQEASRKGPKVIILSIYGAIDPHTAAAADPGSTNNIKIVQDNEDHSFSLDDLDRKDDLINELESWLDININN